MAASGDSARGRCEIHRKIFLGIDKFFRIGPRPAREFRVDYMLRDGQRRRKYFVLLLCVGAEVPRRLPGFRGRRNSDPLTGRGGMLALGVISTMMGARPALKIRTNGE